MGQQWWKDKMKTGQGGCQVTYSNTEGAAGNSGGEDYGVGLQDGSHFWQRKMSKTSYNLLNHQV